MSMSYMSYMSSVSLNDTFSSSLKSEKMDSVGTILGKFFLRNILWIFTFTFYFAFIFANLIGRLVSILGILLDIVLVVPFFMRGKISPGIFDNLLLPIPPWRNNSERFGIFEEMSFKSGMVLGVIAVTLPAACIGILLLPVYNLAFFIKFTFFNPDWKKATHSIVKTDSYEVGLVKELRQAAKKQSGMDKEVNRNYYGKLYGCKSTYYYETSGVPFFNFSIDEYSSTEINKEEVYSAKYAAKSTARIIYIEKPKEKAQQWCELRKIVREYEDNDDATPSGEQLDRACAVLGLLDDPNHVENMKSAGRT